MITLRHTTLGRTPLDEWPARRSIFGYCCPEILRCTSRLTTCTIGYYHTKPILSILRLISRYFSNVSFRRATEAAWKRNTQHCHVYPSVRMECIVSHWRVFFGGWNFVFGYVIKFFATKRFGLKSVKNYRYFTLRPAYICNWPSLFFIIERRSVLQDVWTDDL